MHSLVTQPDTPPSAILQMTPFCRRLGLTAPVVQAPIGSASTPELAAAVSNAGGLGMLALSWTPEGCQIPDLPGGFGMAGAARISRWSCRSSTSPSLRC
jgi:Nitronate monooxygenase